MQKGFLLDKHFYNRRVRNDSITTTKTIKFADTIVISNKIMDLLKEYEVYDQFKKRFIRKKIYATYNRFSQVDEVYKEEFFKRIQEDFKNHEKEFKNDYVFLKKVNPRIRYIFNTALASEDYKEFELKVEIYLLKKRNKGLIRKRKRLKKNIKKYEKLNDEILNSKSWKITRPFRKISGGLK